ncbi:MAG: hypothetical protein WBM75_06935 [Polyangiales bacterium]
MTKIACGAALALLGLVGSACGGGPCGDAEDRPVPLTDLPCSMTDAGGVWYSHPFPPISDAQCYWLEFRGCSQYQIEHPLGRAPVQIVGYTSFDQDGSFSTPASGNSFVVQEVSDSTVTIRNAQNQLFYLRLTLD